MKILPNYHWNVGTKFKCPNSPTLFIISEKYQDGWYRVNWEHDKNGINYTKLQIEQNFRSREWIKI